MECDGGESVGVSGIGVKVVDCQLRNRKSSGKVVTGLNLGDHTKIDRKGRRSAVEGPVGTVP